MECVRELRGGGAGGRVARTVAVDKVDLGELAVGRDRLGRVGEPPGAAAEGPPGAEVAPGADLNEGLGRGGVSVDVGWRGLRLVDVLGGDERVGVLFERGDRGGLNDEGLVAGCKSKSAMGTSLETSGELTGCRTKVTYFIRSREEGVEGGASRARGRVDEAGGRTREGRRAGELVGASADCGRDGGRSGNASADGGGGDDGGGDRGGGRRGRAADGDCAARLGCSGDGGGGVEREEEARGHRLVLQGAGTGHAGHAGHAGS